MNQVSLNNPVLSNPSYQFPGSPAIVRAPGQVMRGSSKASFRKFMAEAPVPLMGLQKVSNATEPTIHVSDPSGALRKTFLDSLRAAKTSIECLTFTFSDPEMVQLLEQKAKEGVKITVVIDKDHRGSLLPLANQIHLVTRNTGEGRIHHKIAVIDGKKVWIGSANFSPEALRKQNNTMIQLESPELARAIQEEIDAFLGQRARTTSQLPPIQMGDQSVEFLLFPHVPFDRIDSPEKALNQRGKERLLQMIDQAQTSLRCAVCVWTDVELAKAVIAAKERGVNVEVLLWKKGESPEIASLFERNGIRVMERPDLTLMHNKWMLVDDTTLFNGSANWSNSWFSRNDESAVILHHLPASQLHVLLDSWNFLTKR